MVQTFKEYQLGNHCGHVSYEELEKACFGYIQNIAVLEKRLEIACHIKADDKVGFDFAILDKVDALERKYYELIMAVETKCPNETRHETALRYIKNAESFTTDQVAKKEKKMDDVRNL